MELIKLSYRELAERLGLTPDAARMKAKRMAAAGKWRVIPGNHPQDKVYVELPVVDLPIEPPRSVVAAAPAPAPAAPRPDAFAEGALALIAEAQQRVAAITDQLVAAKDDLLAEKDGHRKTAEALAQQTALVENLRAQLETASEQLVVQATKPRVWQPGRWRR